MKKLCALLIVVTVTIGTVSAAEWQGPSDIEKAAQLGNPEAQLEMGILYEFGFFMADNKAPALAWYILSANQGNRQAVERRDILQAKMTPEEIEQAKKMSLTLAPNAPAPMTPPAESPQPIDGGAAMPMPAPAPIPTMEPVPSPQSSAERDEAAKALTDSLSTGANTDSNGSGADSAAARR